MQHITQSMLGEVVFLQQSAIASNHTAQQLYDHYLSLLIECSQRTYGTGEDSASYIASMLASVTHGNIYLYLHPQAAHSSLTMLPYVPGRRAFPVSWGDSTYGSLQVRLIDDESLVLPACLCERLARDCGWCLHILEKEIQYQQQQHHQNEEAQKKVSSLSTAQYTVLQFMVKGFSTRAIADILHISKRTVETHQRCIYQVLDVHSQREAILIGLAAGLAVS